MNEQPFNYKMIEPLADMVLIRAVAAETTDGGIVIPDVARQRMAQRKGVRVVAVGPGRYSATGALIEPRVKVGDLVCIGSGCNPHGFDFDPEIALVHEEDLICRFTGAEN